jgi:hypothetical protein
MILLKHTILTTSAIAATITDPAHGNIATIDDDELIDQLDVDA